MKSAKATLNRLSNSRKMALKFARALNREVRESNCDRSLFCSAGGDLYISWRPLPGDCLIFTARACDGLPIGDEYAGSGEGWATFDDVEDAAFEGDVARIQDEAAELAAA